MVRKGSRVQVPVTAPKECKIMSKLQTRLLALLFILTGIFMMWVVISFLSGYLLVGCTIALVLSIIYSVLLLITGSADKAFSMLVNGIF
jgi:hypothetical protein